MKRLAGGALAAVLMLGGAGQAKAVGWTPAVALPPANQPDPLHVTGAENERIVVASSGAQAMSWDDIIQPPDDSVGNCLGGEATTRVPGGAWAPATVTGCDTLVQIGPTGAAVAVWEVQVSNPPTCAGQEQVQTCYLLYAATTQAGSSFGTPDIIDEEVNPHRFRVAAVDPQGRATVAWRTNAAVRVETQNADGSWPGAVTARDNVYLCFTCAMGLAIGPTGDAVLAYMHEVPGLPSERGIDVLDRPAGSPSWTPTTLVPTSSTINFPSGPVLYTGVDPIVAIDPQNQPTVLVSLADNGTYELLSWTRPADPKTWSPSELVPNSDSTACSTCFARPALAVDSHGNAQASFVLETPTGFEFRAATRAPGPHAPLLGVEWKPQGSPDTLGPVPCANPGRGIPGQYLLPPSVSFDVQDTANIAFSCNGTTYMYSRAAGSTTYSPFTPPAGATAPTIVTDPNGYLIATWTSGGITYTSVYDGIAPSVDSVSPPLAPVAGEPAAFTVTGSDVWGPVTFSVDFGDGSPPATGRLSAPARGLRARASVTNTVSHTYTTATDYTATITVNDSAGNSTTTNRLVSVAPAPAPTPIATTGQVVPDLPPVTGLPDPVAGLTVNVAPVRPVVLVKEPGAPRFVPLTAPAQVRVGSIIDVTKGRVRITIDNGHGGFDTADFYAGVFQILQLKGKVALATLKLVGGSFRGCPRAPKVKLAKTRRKRSLHGAVRRLWGEGKGAFRTSGRFSAATIRGTTWLTLDRCDGTLTRVKVGSVSVRDFVLRKTVVVTQGKSYFARPLRKR